MPTSSYSLHCVWPIKDAANKRTLKEPFNITYMHGSACYSFYVSTDEVSWPWEERSWRLIQTFKCDQTSIKKAKTKTCLSLFFCPCFNQRACLLPSLINQLHLTDWVPDRRFDSRCILMILFLQDSALKCFQSVTLGLPEQKEKPLRLTILSLRCHNFVKTRHTL